MPETAQDVMSRHFGVLSPKDTIAQAVARFRQLSQETGHQVFGMMVTDEAGKLVGMLSMYDVLLLLRPKHTHIWGEMRDLELDGLINAACRRAQGYRVGDIMTTTLTTVAPDTHLMLIIDLMIKKHVRRLPVVEEGRLVGIVYLSQLFAHLGQKLTG
jgi:CBS domain-containing protein